MQALNQKSPGTYESVENAYELANIKSFGDDNFKIKVVNRDLIELSEEERNVFLDKLRLIESFPKGMDIKEFQVKI